jgi:hypothetical protein
MVVSFVLFIFASPVGLSATGESSLLRNRQSRK